MFLKRILSSRYYIRIYFSTLSSRVPVNFYPRFFLPCTCPSVSLFRARARTCVRNIAMNSQVRITIRNDYVRHGNSLATLFKDTTAPDAAVAAARYHLHCRALSSSLSHPLYDHTGKHRCDVSCACVCTACLHEHTETWLDLRQTKERRHRVMINIFGVACALWTRDSRATASSGV